MWISGPASRQRAAQSAKHAEQERKGSQCWRMGRCVACCFRLLEAGEELRGSDCEDEADLRVCM